MGFNTGEWSELYVLLQILLEPNLVVVNECLTKLNEDSFNILEINVPDKDKELNFIVGIDNITKNINDVNTTYEYSYVQNNRDVLLKKIMENSRKKGTYDIVEIDDFVKDFLEGRKIKGVSNSKADIVAIVLDKKLNSNKNLGYSIKSQIGEPATLLNASQSTNFIYRLSGITDEQMNEINNINTNTKLIDRFKKIIEYNITLEYIKLNSDIFSSNLKFVDTQMDIILSKILLEYYSTKESSLNDLLPVVYDLFEVEDKKTFVEDKIGSLLNAIAFGMFPDKIWDGNYTVKGGIIVVKTTGDVVLLDLIYYDELVKKYLLSYTKLETGSSTKHKFFNIYKENNEFFIKLNLQIRFIK